MPSLERTDECTDTPQQRFKEAMRQLGRTRTVELNLNTEIVRLPALVGACLAAATTDDVFDPDAFLVLFGEKMDPTPPSRIHG